VNLWRDALPVGWRFLRIKSFPATWYGTTPRTALQLSSLLNLKTRSMTSSRACSQDKSSRPKVEVRPL